MSLTQERRPNVRAFRSLLLAGFVASLLAMGVGEAFAQGTAPAITIDRPVVDPNRVLEPAAVDRLETALRTLLSEHGVHMAVLIVRGPLGEPIEDFSHRTAQKWGGGTKSADSGVLLVMSIGDRRMRLEHGYGIEAGVSDATAKQILDRVRPLMRVADYAAAIAAIISDVGRVAAGLEVPRGEIQPLVDYTRRRTHQALSALALLLGAFVSVALWQLRRRLTDRRLRWAVVWGVALAGVGIGAAWAPDGFWLAAVGAQLPLLPVGYLIGRGPRGSIIGTILLAALLSAVVLVYGLFFASGAPAEARYWAMGVFIFVGILMLGSVALFASYVGLLLVAMVAGLIETGIRKQHVSKSRILKYAFGVGDHIVNALSADPKASESMGSGSGSSYSAGSSSRSSWSSSSSASSSSSSSSSSGSSGWSGGGGSFGGGGASSSW